MKEPSLPMLEDPSPPPLLEVRGLSKAYGRTAVLRGVEFALAPGETLAVLGDSGCGKTTLLRILAGLIAPSAGDVVLARRTLNGVPPRDRGIVYLDQEPLLFEHLTVRENVAFAPRMQKRPAEETARSVDAILSAIGLAEHAGKREWQLSGGQKQRVAFARAVLARPRILLLDEPFSSLDARTRTAMRTLFHSLRRRYSLTSLFVTHDVKEALMVGDRFALMAGGSLRVYPDRASFLRDDATGIPGEIGFWRSEAERESP